MNPPLDYMGSDYEFVEVVFVAEYKGKKLRAYEERYKHYYDEDKWVWDTRYVLEFIDDKHRREWLFPYLSSIRDLLESIKYIEAGIDSFIEDVLGDLSED